MEKLGVREWLTIALASVAAIGSMAVSQYRVGIVEEGMKALRDEPMRLTLLERDMRLLRCEIRNVKAIVKSLPERDCD